MGRGGDFASAVELAIAGRGLSVIADLTDTISNQAAPEVEFEGVYCRMSIAIPVDGVVILAIAGSDIGEFKHAPFEALSQRVRTDRKVELFIDAGATKAASLEVSQDWALWLGVNRERLHQVTMLIGSRFIDVTANFVRSFSRMEGVMRLTSDRAAFDEALNDALRARRSPRDDATPCDGAGISAES